MSRMSARFVAQKVGMTTQWVYDMWKDMGLVDKDKFGDWILTAAGRAIGGRMSKGSRLEVPTFEFEVIEKMMVAISIMNCVNMSAMTFTKHSTVSWAMDIASKHIPMAIRLPRRTMTAP